MKTVKNYLFKSFVLLSCVCVSLAFVQCKSEKDKQAEQGLAEAAKMINAQTPIMLDQVTRLDNVKAEGKTLTYEGTILGDTSALKPEDLEKNVKALLKGNPQLQLFAQYDVILKYKYVDEKGNVFAEFSLNPSDYK